MTSAYAKTYRVASYDVGPDSRLTLPALLRSLHDVAQQHAGSVGFGYRDLIPRDLAWALVTLELSLKLRPLGEEEMTLATSVTNTAGPLVYRDYLGTLENSSFVVGQSLWALIDLNTRRTTLLPIDLKQKLAGIQLSLQDEIERVRRFSNKKVLAVVDYRKVRAHDCDFNGHLNNVVSARWMLDSLYDYNPKLANRLSSINISYHQEALLNEKLNVGLMEIDHHFSIELRRTDGVLVATGLFK